MPQSCKMEMNTVTQQHVPFESTTHKRKRFESNATIFGFSPKKHVPFESMTHKRKQTQQHEFNIQDIYNSLHSFYFSM